jgi:hypothetical protein
MAVFCAWIDCYTVASKKIETGMLSLTMAASIKRICQFSIGVIIIFAGFCLFGSALYQKEDNFATIGTSVTTIFAVGFGDAVRQNMMDIQGESFGTIFAILTIGVFYSALSQVYVGIFIVKYEKRMKAAKKWLQSQKQTKKLLLEQAEGEQEAQRYTMFEQESHLLDKYTVRFKCCLPPTKAQPNVQKSNEVSPIIIHRPHSRWPTANPISAGFPSGLQQSSHPNFTKTLELAEQKPATKPPPPIKKTTADPQDLTGEENIMAEQKNLMHRSHIVKR